MRKCTQDRSLFAMFVRNHFHASQYHSTLEYFIVSVTHADSSPRDVLLRHVSLHDLPTPSKRGIGTACDSCRRNKTRCDGGARCSFCLKRDIVCTYGGTTQAPTDFATNSDPVPLAVGAMPSQSATMLHSDTPQTSSQKISTSDSSLWLAAVLAQIYEASTGQAFSFEAEIQEWLLRGADMYFTCFHDRWPFVHASSFDWKVNDVQVVVSAAIIGFWYKTSEVHEKQMIIKAHTAMVEHLIPQLVGRYYIKCASTRSS